MKVLLTVFLSLMLLASVASAELLVTALPLGQGSLGVLGAGIQDSNWAANNSGWTLTTIGGYVGYGVLDQLDLLVTLGSANAGGLPAGISASGTAYGALLKYTVVQEGKDFPVSVAVGAGYKFLAMTFAGTSANGNQAVVALGLSKIFAPFVPYLGATYRGTAYNNAASSTQFDITAGSAIAWSQQGAVYVEYTSQSITPNGGTGYTSGQIAAGVGYKIM
ncbi:MAG: hypothetical protein KKB81_05945 [Candidatus Margulisbacteria bacterium]|nr:hypothetical protein [Candidatus Margulisiibacteriota bacterium]MBU1021403.1 hypothetical protein [Candidatus Margulisiibacteriota bacterium]MBU1728324.1 hypothetical protein [Candidatus Margulisiibacteriota bacterium]MBU1955933.1 hypothetical protein [Candidatus Margulisiibacteriota bacterium]